MIYFEIWKVYLVFSKRVIWFSDKLRCKLKTLILMGIFGQNCLLKLSNNYYLNKFKYLF